MSAFRRPLGLTLLAPLALLAAAVSARLEAAERRHAVRIGPQSPPRSRYERYESGKATKVGKGVSLSFAQQRRVAKKARNVRRNRAPQPCAAPRKGRPMNPPAPKSKQDMMLDELQRKAGLLMQNAIGPVISQIGRDYGREGVIAFCAAMQQHLALETREAFGTGIAMEVLKNVVANVMAVDQEAAHDEMVDAASKLVMKKLPLQ